MNAVALVLLLGLERPPQETDDPKPVNAPGFLANFQHALGRSFPGPWQPFVLDLGNNLGSDLEVRIRVEDDFSRTVVTRRETVPRQTQRRVFVYLPSGAAGMSGASGQAKYRLTDPSGRLLAAGMLPPSGRVWGEPPFVVGLLSGETGTDRALAAVQQSGGRQLEVGRFTAATFPDRWIGLTPLDALVLHDPPLDQFTPDQARALVEWVRQGGTVFLAPGRNRGIYTHDLVKSLASIRAGEPETRDSLPRLTTLFGPFRERKEFVYHRIDNGDEKYFPESGREVVSFPAGYGRLVALRFNVREAPFDTWPGLDRFWQRLFDLVPRRHRLEESNLSPVSTHQDRLRLFQILAAYVNPYPSFLLLIGITVLFLAAVGPANYLVLRRLRMTILVVLSVPAVSAGFLALILGLGYLLKGTSTVVHSVRFLHTRTGLDCARETQLFSIFSPSTRTYEVSFAPGAYGLPLERLDDQDESRTLGFGRMEGERLECDQDAAGMTFRGVGVGQWQSRHVLVRSAGDLGGAVRFDADGTLLRISNGTKRAIARGVYFKIGRGGSASPFGAIPAGGSIETPLVAAPYDPLRDLGLAPDSFAGRLLREHFAQLPHLFRSESVTRMKEFLLCVLEEEAPPVRVDARLSSDSRSLTLLQVLEDRP